MIRVRKVFPLLGLLVGIASGCGGAPSSGSPSGPSDPGGSSGPMAKPQVTIAWPARTRAVAAPASADLAFLTFQKIKAGPTVLQYTARRPIGPAASTQTYTASDSLSQGSYLLNVSFAVSNSGRVAYADVPVTVGSDGVVVGEDGKPLGPISLTGQISRVEVESGQNFDSGETKDLVATVFQSASNVTAVDYGAITFQITGGASHLQVNADGSLTGLSEGVASIVASVDGIRSAPVAVRIFGTPVFVRTLALRTSRLVVAPDGGRIFASLSEAGAVAPIDPASGTVGASIAVGRQPNALALSDDGSTLYVGLDGDEAVRPVDLTSGTAGAAFGATGNRDLYVSDLAVAPRSPATLAVAAKFSSTRPGVSIFEGGVPRPASTGSATGDYVVWTSPSRLIASHAGELREVAVDEGGATVVRTVTEPSTTFGNLSVVEGRLYTQSGGVFDATTLTKLGQFVQTSSLRAGVVNFSAPTVDVAQNRVYFVESLYGEDYLHVYRLDTFEEITVRHLTGLGIPSSGFAMGGASLVRWGASGLAYREDTKVVFLDASGL